MFSSPTEILRQCGISPGSVIGDFGTGAGAYAHEAAKLVGTGGAVYAFDVQKGMIERLAREVKDVKDNVIHPLWVDLELPRGTLLEDGVLDLAIIANILFQIENKESFMKEVARVVRPSGRVLAVDWKESFGNMGPHPGHVVTEARTKELARDAGLTFDKNIDAGAHHYGLIFRKNV